LRNIKSCCRQRFYAVHLSKEVNMDARRIVLIQGHPDALIPHLGHALEDAYAQGAEAGGHEVRRVAVAQLDFPLLRSEEAWKDGALPAALAQAQTAGTFGLTASRIWSATYWALSVLPRSTRP
jgi:hypothetical protein